MNRMSGRGAGGEGWTGPSPRQTGSSPRRIARNLQRTARNPRRTARNLRRTARNLRRTARNPRRTARNPRRTARNLRRTARNLRRRESNAEATDGNAVCHNPRMAPDWYPTRLADRSPWHANYNTNAQATGTTFGLSAADKTDAANDAANVALVVNYKEAAEAYAQAVTEWADLILEGLIGTPMPATPTGPAAPLFALSSKAAVEARTRLQVGIIKADPDYTAQVGENYGIVGTGPAAPGTPAA